MADIVQGRARGRRARLLDVAHDACTGPRTASWCPGTRAGEDELLGIGRALGEAGHGVFQVASDLVPEDDELGWMKQLSAETGRPVSPSRACRTASIPTSGGACSRPASEDAAEGGHLTPQVAQRPAGLLLGFESTVHPFVFSAGYQTLSPLCRSRSGCARLADPEVRASILDDPPDISRLRGRHRDGGQGLRACMFPLGDPPDYEPGPEKSIAAIAEREGRTRTRSPTT